MRRHNQEFGDGREAGDRAERHQDLMIRVHGYVVVQVTTAWPWSYTIGVQESWGQPDLLILDVDPVVQAQLLLSVLDDHIDFGRLDPPTSEALDLEVVTVDGHHFDGGLVSAWEERYGRRARTGDFLQLIPRPSWFGSGPWRRPQRLDRGPVA